jgi:2-dehydro-3-deoxyphosphogluconate aldolase/(4S)-4-hydroxy-2-oxoglutarate aldolase
VGAVNVDELMATGPVIPVLTIERLQDAAPLARALVQGGLRPLEVTLRTDCALEAIAIIAREVPDAIVGAGTVLNTGDFDRATRAGARFVVSPGLTDPLIAAARASAIPFLPGVVTAGEVMRGLDAGLTRFKFFPAESSGGVGALKALYRPLPQCRFCPTGGVTAVSAAAWLVLPNVLCVGGAWVAPADAIAAGDWPRITALARAASALGRQPAGKPA